MYASITLMLASIVLAGSSPPIGALVVGPNAQYKTIQAAVDAAANGKTIFIEAGTYKEQVFVNETKQGLTLMGATSTPESYSGNRVTITQGRSQADKINNDATGTLRAHGDGLKVYNINLVNSKGKGSQALALSAYGDNQGYYGCQFKGYQDTVLTERGHHVFVNSMIEGATDFIFGMHSLAWFEKVDIKVTDGGWITANGRDSATNPSFYVLNRCTVEGSSSKLNGKAYLGRPWREFARVVFQHSKLGAVVNTAGWSQWQSTDPKTGNVTFGEFGNTGPGASGSRKFGTKLGAAVSINDIIPNHRTWVDSKYVRGDYISKW
ncbi:pectin lyase-like protein [Microthyrium microscopicum]|uniref:Pectinesterase n=1 Tax=Microthyrium microscopicum TaxID=703497 RepID=A0A6A6U866_9PEZI|nr:pectin lyase-like protein [Microthyrium microscopicum]